MSADDSDPADEKVREQLEDRAEELDARIVDLLAWVLDTETRARIYVHLREHPNSTSEEIAEGTGLYPSTVREALAELTADEKVDRHKRESSGAGNNPYEYEAIAPSKLVGDVVEEVQGELNTVFNLDEFLGGQQSKSESSEGPVSIEVQSEDE
ncbi:winged helix-turn-helix domain-containing protein [Halorarius litoreus]|uniref:winged helix-turn-helix domain-containing protein n=1 Tax=Halorarius litoreus TaxID=2962676 RepID=UPI0020CED7D0|nr:winged helix-turn-helix domain-containing protein [Halorarius litoreus]